MPCGKRDFGAIPVFLAGGFQAIGRTLGLGPGVIQIFRGLRLCVRRVALHPRIEVLQLLLNLHLVARLFGCNFLSQPADRES